MKMHSSITTARLIETIENAGLTSPGICASCGEDADGCEPDMENGPCESCGEDAVFGAEQLLIMMS
jgi:hypothetical protein